MAQGLYDTYDRTDYLSANYGTATSQFYSPATLSASDRYRLQYGNLPFYGDTTNRSTYQRIEPPPREPSLQSFYGGGTKFSLNDLNDHYNGSRQTSKDTIRKPASRGSQFGNVMSDRENSNVSEYLDRYGHIPFYGDTTNRTVYTTKALEPRESHRLNGDVSYRSGLTPVRRASSFRKPDGIPYETSRPASSTSTVTTHRSEYGPKQGERAYSFEPRRRNILSGALSAPELDTTKQLEYAPRHEERTRNYKPFGQTWSDDTLSTHRYEYGPKKSERSRSYKPKDDKLWYGEAFDDQTTSRSAYDPKVLPTRTASFRPKHLRLAAPEDSVTPKLHGARPGATPNHLGFETGDRADNVTVSRAEYVPKRAERAKAFNPPTTIGLTQGSIRATSVTGEDYRPWAVRKMASFKHDHTLVSSQQFNGKTTHREDYGPKAVEPCPAELLLRSKSDYRYIFNRGGHRFYRKLTGQNEAVTDGKIRTEQHVYPCPYDGHAT